MQNDRSKGNNRIESDSKNRRSTLEVGQQQLPSRLQHLTGFQLSGCFDNATRGGGEMLLSDLILLGIAFGAGCIYLEASEELHCLLSGIIGSICLILGLILAPWPIQLGLAILSIALDKLIITKDFRSSKKLPNSKDAIDFHF